MPKPLDARIAAAMSNDARAATIADLITDVEAGIAACEAERDRLDILSKSATATEAEADAAGDAATKLARKAIRLSAKCDRLRGRYNGLIDARDRKKRVIEQFGPEQLADAVTIASHVD
jgi:N-methylhydantoinase B/oxoprolinase/acetone carboxylase alpha subunit